LCKKERDITRDFRVLSLNRRVFRLWVENSCRIFLLFLLGWGNAVRNSRVEERKNEEEVEEEEEED